MLLFWKSWEEVSFLFLIDLGEPSLPSPNLGFIQDPGEFPAVGSFVSDNLKALLVI